VRTLEEKPLAGDGYAGFLLESKLEDGDGVGRAELQLEESLAVGYFHYKALCHFIYYNPGS